MKQKYTFAIVTLAFSMSACTNNNIKAVKAQISQNSEYTYGQILENRSFCKDTSWEAKNDLKNRSIVEYTCNFAIDAAAVENAKKASLDFLAGRMTQVSNAFTKTESELPELLTRTEEYEKATTRGNYTSDIRDINQRINRIKEQPQSQKIVSELERLETELQDLTEKNEESLKAQMEGSQRKIQEVKDSIASVAAFKERYIAKVKEVETQDRQQIEALYTSNVKLQQKLTFLVQENEVKLIKFDALVNGKPITTSIEGAYVFAAEIAAPQGKQVENNWQSWWMKNMAQALELSVNQFPYSCGTIYGCREKSSN